MRSDGRPADGLRPCSITIGFQEYAEGSALIELGRTKVLCAASIEDKVPPFRKGTGSGWVTAEYSMLPRSTLVRSPRDIGRGRINGRAQEIQRILGRVLRAVTNLDALQERTVWIDCDVLQADGGTRTASITGAYVALALAAKKLLADGLIADNPLCGQVAAVSVGLVGGEPLLDLTYDEDFSADVDLNVAMTSDDRFVELQGTAEVNPFDRAQLDLLLELARKGICEMFSIQNKVLYP